MNTKTTKMNTQYTATEPVNLMQKTQKTITTMKYQAS